MAAKSRGGPELVAGLDGAGDLAHGDGVVELAGLRVLEDPVAGEAGQVGQ
jgi:hypothetical protein